MVKYTDFITLHDVPETKERARAIAGRFGNVSKVLREAIHLGLEILEKEQSQEQGENDE